MNYLFDVDGTLTPSRLPIDEGFESFFLSWMKGKNVYLVTGSDKDKTIEQVGEEIWNSCTRVYQSCGNAVYEKGKLIRQLDFVLDTKLKKLLNEFLLWSSWEDRYQTNIEERIGLINFSVVGRDCPQEVRERYYKWDLKAKERETFCQIIEEKFPEIEASVGGQISIDIYPKGKNKGQILDELEGSISFFGDRCEPGGNDYPIVKMLFPLIDEHTIHSVKNWRNTWEILKKRL